MWYSSFICSHRNLIALGCFSILFYFYGSKVRYFRILGKKPLLDGRVTIIFRMTL